MSRLGSGSITGPLWACSAVDAVHYEPISQAGIVQVYDSLERKAYKSEWKDREGYWTSVDDLYLIVGSPGEDMDLNKAALIVEGLKDAGIDFAVGVPDAQFTQVYQKLSKQTDIPYIGAANEGEAAGIAMGAWFGGKKPALIIATSGLLVATYWLARMQFLHEVPVLILIPYRGDIGDPMWMGMYRKTTEPTLQTLDIPFRVVDKSADIKRVMKECNECARAWLKSVAVLITGEALW